MQKVAKCELKGSITRQKWNWVMQYPFLSAYKNGKKIGLRGYCTSYPKLPCLCSISKLSTPWKIVYAPYSKLPKELKNGIEFLLGQVVFFRFRIKTFKMLFGSVTQELLGLLKVWCYFWVPLTIYYKMHTLFFKKVLIILR